MSSAPYRLQGNVSFHELQSSEAFVDVTIACEERSLKAHRIVLAACSPFFHKLLIENPCTHPVIIMPDDICFSDLRHIIEFVYTGEVDVQESGLKQFLATADRLKIKGLRAAPESDESGSRAQTTTTGFAANWPAVVKLEPLSDNDDTIDSPVDPLQLTSSINDIDVMANFEAVSSIMKGDSAEPRANRASSSVNNANHHTHFLLDSSSPSHDAEKPKVHYKSTVFDNKSIRKWTAQDMEAALRAIRTKRMSVIKAAAYYNIPRSTLFQKRGLMEKMATAGSSGQVAITKGREYKTNAFCFRALQRVNDTAESATCDICQAPEEHCCCTGWGATFGLH